jgi:hypothetical protein
MVLALDDMTSADAEKDILSRVASIGKVNRDMDPVLLDNTQHLREIIRNVASIDTTSPSLAGPPQH